MYTLDIDEKKNAGFYVTKRTVVILVAVVVVVIVAVGLIAGLVKPACPTSTTPEIITSPEPTSDTVSTVSSTTLGPEPWYDPFLPNYTIPVHYDLFLYPDFYNDAHWFWGEETIHINVTQETKYLIVHYKEMNITKSSVRYSRTNISIPVKAAFPYDPNEFWVVELNNIIAAGSQVLLTLNFNGNLNNGIIGYYKSTYMNTITGKESWLATSKFQPTHARKAFPNFDEPEYKATFQITLKHWKNFTALSNMLPESNRSVDPTFMETVFQKSVPMSSYLVCFIVCDFVYTEKELKSGKKHRVWAQPDRINQTTYALNIGTTVQDYLEQEYNMSFHMPKLDQVAVPDYPSGATEHWGIITYRVTSLLFDEAEVSSSGRARVASVVAHELTHNYFGDPVTCKWWNDIWLNEGFAVWVQNEALQVALPLWRPEEAFVVNTMQPIMRSDAFLTSRPVVVPVETPDQINEAFDGITYSKGASIVRFMQNMFGKTLFREGIKHYLKKHEYSTVTTDDLWAALQDKVGEYNVKALMDPWTRQMGLPVVNISSITGTDPRFIAKRGRFLLNPSDDQTKPDSLYGYKWSVPLYYVTKNNISGVVWINDTSDTVDFSIPLQNDEWVKFNHEQRVFVRVNYDDTMWKTLAEQLNTDMYNFSAIDRANLLDDVFNLAKATQLQYSTALDMTTYMSNEMDYLPWVAVRDSLNYISDRLYGRTSYNKWREHVRKIANPLMNKLRLDDIGDHLERLLRTDIVDLACRHGTAECIQNTSAIFRNWIDDGNNTVAPNLRSLVYKYGMQELGTEDNWNKMLNLYKESNVDQEKLSLLRGMAYTPKVWLLQRYLENTMDEGVIRSQDFFNAISYIGGNPVGNLVAWDWLRENYDAIVKRFGLNNRYLGRMVPDFISGYNTKFQLEQVEAFFAKYPDAGAGQRSREQAVASIKSNIDWLKLSELSIEKWLTDNYP